MKTIYHGGRVYTGELPLCQGFTVEDGRFGFVGDDAQLLPLAREGDETMDLGGRFVCAGFNDSHLHLLGYGDSLRAAQLAAHTQSLAEVQAYLRSFLRDRPPRAGEWLVGRGWNQDYFTDVRRMPDRHDLDAVSTEIPIMITRACGHCCVVNSRALALAGIDGNTASIAGGAVGMADGAPDGRLYDNAMELLRPCLPQPDEAAIRERIALACAELNRRGVTSVQSDDYCVFRDVPFETVNAAYRALEAEGALTVRVYEQCNFTALPELERFLAAGNRTGVGSDRFRIGPLKLLGDGSLGGRTAWLSRPYADDADRCGFPLFTAEEMRALIGCANAHGMQVAVHAIGDRCLDQVLDAIEAALRDHPRADHRHGIVHCQITRPEQLQRIRELGLHVYAQSIFLDYDNHIVEKRVGPELAATSYCWKTLLRGGVSVSNGSDCPVELPDVMEGIECAVTRRSLDGTGPYLPDEAFTVQEALDSFTVRGAEASFEENVKGRIRPGYLADFTVLDRDPFSVEPRALHTVPVRATYLGGARVHGEPL